MMPHLQQLTTNKFWMRGVFLAQNVIYGWAMVGGLLLAAVVGMNTLSIIGAIFWQPIPGDFEMTEMGVAVAAFAFLPYCQLIGANVSADIFTSAAKPRTVGVFKILGSVVAMGFSALLLWRMTYGMMDQYQYGYTTSILRFPHWFAYVPILVSLGLLFVAALITTAQNFVQIRLGVDHE
jgi:TRAP-type C4-dicarboxylate transport system permease small subunit